MLTKTMMETDSFPGSLRRERGDVVEGTRWCGVHGEQPDRIPPPRTVKLGTDISYQGGAQEMGADQALNVREADRLVKRRLFCF